MAALLWVSLRSSRKSTLHTASLAGVSRVHTCPFSGESALLTGFGFAGSLCRHTPLGPQVGGAFPSPGSPHSRGWLLGP